ncbi:MAG: FKBP-type peptidyl-prolyl cis-trans isomerase [Saprospiraceae bacterium]
MKKLLYFIPMALLFAACDGGAAGGGKNLPMTNQNDSTSYAYGTMVADNLKQIKEDVGEEHAINLDLFTNGIRDAVADNPKLTKEEADKVMKAFGQMAQAAAQKKKQEEDLKNVGLGQAYLAENKVKEGVQVTPSGLQYKIIKEGTGAQPVATDDVTVHYTGKLIDGTVFDSSVQRGQPASFNVSGVIPGWTEGLQMMKEGAKYEFYIPSDLGYGPQGNPRGGIAGNSVLVFDVELIKIGK